MNVYTIFPAEVYSLRPSCPTVAVPVAVVITFVAAAAVVRIVFVTAAPVLRITFVTTVNVAWFVECPRYDNVVVWTVTDEPKFPVWSVTAVPKFAVCSVTVGVTAIVYECGRSYFTNTSVPSLASSVEERNRSASVPSPTVNATLFVHAFAVSKAVSSRMSTSSTPVFAAIEFESVNVVFVVVAALKSL